MDKKKKSGKRTLILVGISVICIVVGALSWGYYKKVTEFKTSKCDFVPPSSFDAVVQKIDIEKQPNGGHHRRRYSNTGRDRTPKCNVGL